MLRRKPNKIGVKPNDKDELEQLRRSKPNKKPNPNLNNPSSSSTSLLHKLFYPSPSSKSHCIGLNN